MSTALNSPSFVDPVKAQGFYSFVVTIDDDDVYSFVPKGACGHLLIATTSVDGHGGFWYRNSSIVKQFGAANTVGATGVLSGSTGADGQTAVSVNSGTLYIENRSGAECEYTVTIFAQNSTYE
jgi:hypothetical protein